MADQTLAALTAATPATGGIFYGTQDGADRKFTLTAAGAALCEAATALKLDELAAPTDVTTLDATTSAHGLMSKSDKTKLNGVASGADVTNATSVAAAIAATTAKTPVDNDLLGLLDSASSYVLKKLSWSTLKTSLLSYLSSTLASLSQIVRVDAASSLNATQRQHLAANSGSMVTLVFRLVEVGDVVASGASWDLPALPLEFILLDGYAVIDQTSDAGDSEISMHLRSNDDESVATGTLMLAGSNYEVVTISSAGLTPSVVYTLVIDEVGGPYGVGTHPQGLTLWMRGVWT